MAEIKNSTVGHSLSTKKVVVSRKDTTNQIYASLSTQRINVSKGKDAIVINDHSKLKNLDYLNSGHTGFAGIEYGTTADWNALRDYRPPLGMIVVYTDYAQKTDEHGNIVYIPGIKIGDGNAYLIDKPFITEGLEDELKEHIEDMTRHITQEERQTWNNKLNYVEPEGDLLEFTRD